MVRLTEAMSAVLREKSINVNCVLPTIIGTLENRPAMPTPTPRVGLRQRISPTPPLSWRRARVRHPCLEVGREAAREPHQLDVALSLALQAVDWMRLR